MLERDGFELMEAVLREHEVEALLRELPDVTRGGVRALLENAAVMALLTRLRATGVIPPRYLAVRALLFDKTPEANWALQWHQDTSVAVAERSEVAGFGPWTTKDGVPHALAPASVLAKMINLRVHLDPCGAEAGPLRVLRGSHLRGRVSAPATLREECEEVTCLAGRGDVLAFKPLLVHGSGSSQAAHRRVLQLELSPEELPEPLVWRWRK